MSILSILIRYLLLIVILKIFIIKVFSSNDGKIGKDLEPIVVNQIINEKEILITDNACLKGKEQRLPLERFDLEYDLVF